MEDLAGVDAGKSNIEQMKRSLTKCDPRTVIELILENRSRNRIAVRVDGNVEGSERDY